MKEPTMEEESKSHLLGIVQSAYKNLKSEKDLTVIDKTFFEFVIRTEEFIQTEKNLTVRDYYAQKYARDVILLSKYALSDCPVLIQTNRLIYELTKIVQLPIMIKPLLALLKGCCMNAIHYLPVIESVLPIFDYFFQQEQFFVKFASNSGFELVIECFYVKQHIPEIAQVSNHLLFETTPVQFFKHVNFSNPFTIFFQHIKKGNVMKEIYKEAAIFFGEFFFRMASFNKYSTDFLISNSYLNLLVQILEGFNPENYQTFFSPFLNSMNDNLSPPPNLLILQFLASVAKSHNNFQKDIFNLVYETAKNNTPKISLMEQSVTFSTWFSFEDINISNLVELLDMINQNLPTVLPKCLLNIFISIEKKEMNNQDYIKCVEIIKSQLDTNIFSTNFLANSRFVPAFLFNTSKENLISLYTGKSYFIEKIIEIISMNEVEKYQSDVFQALISIMEEFPSVNQYIFVSSTFLAKLPSQFNMKVLCEKTLNMHNSNYTNIFLYAFVNSVDGSANFVKAGGVDWMFQIYEAKDITIENLVDLISNLVLYSAIPQLDNKISSIDLDHPIFKVPMSFIKKMVYGMNGSLYRPIRIRSIFHLLPPASYIDPYNAYVLRDDYLEHFLENIKEAPMIVDIANRYLQPKYIPKLLEYPELLDKFVDEDRDHFPLFQFYPGEMKFNINTQFTAISFWFKFKDQLQLKSLFFTSDFVSLYVHNQFLLINIEENEQSVEVDVSVWNHFSMRIDQAMLTKTLYYSINGKEDFIIVRKNLFTLATLTNPGNTLMFLAPAIRIYNNTLIDSSLIYSQGPGWMDYADEHNLITPFTNEIKPKNMYAVPYYGFPIHFHSTYLLDSVIKLMHDTPSLFWTIMKINELVKFDQKILWNRLIDFYKKNKDLFGKDIFMKLISKVENSLNYILYDSELWKKLDNVTVVDCLFEYFVDVEWTSIDDFELYLTTIILDNPRSKDIIETIFKNFRKIPTLMKYIITIVKIAPTLRQACCTWDAVEFRDEIPIQCIILESMTNLVNEDTVDIFASLFPFEEVKSLLIVSPISLTIKIFHFVTKVTKLTKDFIIVDDVMLLLVASLSHSHEIWNDMIEICRADEKVTYLPLLLVLVWAGSICEFHRKNYLLPEYSIEKELYEAISICNDHISTIHQRSDCLSIICSWFPSILHYSAYFNSFPNNGDAETDQVEENKKHVLSIQNFPEVFDPLWSRSESIIKGMAFPHQQRPSLPSQFILERISLILSSNGFNLPFSPISVTFDEIINWFGESPVLSFLTDLILDSPNAQVMNSMIYNFFFSLSRSDPITPVFVHYLLCRLSAKYIVSSPVAQILQFIHILVGLQTLQESALVIISDLFTLSAVIIARAGEDELQKLANIIQPIILQLFSSLPIDLYSLIFSNFNKNLNVLITIINSKQALHAWIYAFLVASKEVNKNFSHFIQRLSQQYNFKQEDKVLIDKLVNHTLDRDLESLTLIESAWKAQSNEFQTMYKSLYTTMKETKSHFPSDIGYLSKEFSHFKYISNAKHFLLAQLFSHSLKFLGGTFMIENEKTQWERLMNNIEKEKPMTYHLVTQAQPYYPPRVLTPSPFPYLEMSESTNIRSIPIKLYKQNINYIYTSTSELRMNHLKLFLDHHKYLGTPSFTSDCSIMRYEKLIPSVLLYYPDYVLLLTYSSLSLSGDDLVFQSMTDTKFMHSFIESILIGNWGQVTLYASKIVIKVPLDSIIFVQRMNDTFNIYSYANGFFQIKCNKLELWRRFSKINETSATKLSPTPFLHLIKTKNEMIQQKLTTYQQILVLNGLTGRNACDLNNYPIIPRVIGRNFSIDKFIGFPNSNDILSRLHNVLPFTYFATREKSQSTEEPFNLFASPEFYTDMNHGGANSSDIETNPYHHVLKIRQALENSSVVSWINDAFEVKLQPNQPSTEIPPITGTKVLYQKISNSWSFANLSPFSEYLLRSFFIIVEPNRMQFKITDMNHCKSHFQNNDHLYLHVSKLAVSNNSMFVSMDYSFGITKTYKIIYNMNVPTDVVPIFTKSWKSEPKSIISGFDWICVTATDNVLTTWSIFSGKVHHTFEAESAIVALDMHEYNGIIWFSTEAQLAVLSLNGEIITSYKPEHKITMISVFKKASANVAILGYEDGSISFALLDMKNLKLDIIQLEKVHESPIIAIKIHYSNKVFISKDEEGNLYDWKGVGLNFGNVNPEIYESCALCSNKPTTWCSVCDRATCESCLNAKHICKLCEPPKKG